MAATKSKKQMEKPIGTAKWILVGGFNPSEKYARKIGSFPQIGMNIKHI